MLRYAVEFNIIYCTDITVCVNARNEKEAIRKASKEKILRKQIKHLLQACYDDYGISASKFSSRKNERRQINSIIHNPMNAILNSVVSVINMKEV